MITYVPENLWGEVLPSIDNAELMRSCLYAENYLQKSNVLKEGVGAYGNKTTAAYKDYNLLSFPIKAFQVLYHSIVPIIKPCIPNEPHVLQCWLNVFRGSEYIEWHGHWDKSYRAIHGFYCVNVTPSFTEYQFKHIPDKIFKVDSREGLLVFGKSNDDRHRSSPWGKDYEPRVTIAFDIVPVSTLGERKIVPNHYLPF